MSYSYNHITLIGVIGYIQEDTYNGMLKIRFSIGTERPSYIKDGVEKEPTKDWHHLTVWGGRAELCKKKLKVGEYVAINGEMRYNKDKTDPKKYWNDIYIPENEKIGFLGSMKNSEKAPEENFDNETQSLEKILTPAARDTASKTPDVAGVKPYASNAKINNPFRKKETILHQDQIPF